MKRTLFTIIALSLSMATFTANSATPVATANTFSIASTKAEKAFDGDKETRWATGKKVNVEGSAWLQVDYQEPITVSKVSIIESGYRITKFTLAYKDGDQWVVCLEGTRVGSTYSATLPKPVKAQIFKLSILESKDAADWGPSITEMVLN